jgi:glutathione S-transferase
MKLYGNPISPFVRKCRVVAHILDMPLDFITTQPSGDEGYRRVNPLSKVPALALDDGTVLIDSPVICEYLNHMGGGALFPKEGDARWKALRLQALGDGLSDAAVAHIMLGREAVPPPVYRARQMAAMEAALNVLEGTGFVFPLTIGEITVACALGYVAFRFPDRDWQASHPRLATWYEGVLKDPALAATMPAAP